MIWTLLLLIAVITNSYVKVIGNWSETKKDFEMLEAFNFFSPKNQNKDLNTSNELITGELFKDEITKLDKAILNLSQKTKLFTPKASLKYEVPKKSAEIRGWGALCDNDAEEIHIKDLNVKVFQVLKNEIVDPYERLEFLAEIGKRFPEYAKVLSTFPFSRVAQMQLEKHSYIDVDYMLVNGRTVQTDLISISDAILSEYKFYKIFKEINGTEQYKELIKMWEIPKLRHFTKLPDMDLMVMLYDGSEKNEPIKEEEFIWRRSYTNATVVNLLISPNDDIGKALIYYAFKLEKWQVAARVNVFPVLNLINQTEVTIGKCFYALYAHVGSRQAVEFLRDVINGMDIRKAYEKFKPSKKWNDAMNSEPDSFEHQALTRAGTYVLHKKLNKSVVAMNNEFLNEKAPFHHLKKKIDAVGFQSFVLKSQIEKFNDLSEFWKSISVEIDHIEPPLQIASDDYIDVENDNVHDILQTINEISTTVKIPDTFPFIATFGYESLIPVIKETILNPSQTVKRVLKFDDKATIVGPLLFKKELNKEEMSYAINVVTKMFTIKEENPKIKIASTFLRSTDYVYRRSRQYVMPTDPTILIDEDNPIHIVSNIRFHSEDLPNYAHIISEVANSGAAGIILKLSISKENMDDLLPHMRYHYVTDSDTICNKLIRLYYPQNSWGMIQNGTVFEVKTIYNEGYSRSDIEINGEIFTPTSDNHFIPIYHSIGNYGPFVIDRLVRGRVYATGYRLNLSETFVAEKRNPIIVTKTFGDLDEEKGYKSILSVNKYDKYVYTEWPINVDLYGECIPLVNTLPTFICDGEFGTLKSYVVNKMCFAGFLSSGLILATDPGVTWGCDMSMIFNADLKGCSIGAPMATKSKDHMLPYNNRDDEIARFGRPALNAACFLIDGRKFMSTDASSSMTWAVRLLNGRVIDPYQRGCDILDIAQMYVQCAIMPQSMSAWDFLCTTDELLLAASRVANENIDL